MGNSVGSVLIMRQLGGKRKGASQVPASHGEPRQLRGILGFPGVDPPHSPTVVGTALREK